MHTTVEEHTPSLTKVLQGNHNSSLNYCKFINAFNCGRTYTKLDKGSGKEITIPL